MATWVSGSTTWSSTVTNPNHFSNYYTTAQTYYSEDPELLRREQVKEKRILREKKLKRLYERVKEVEEVFTG